MYLRRCACVRSGALARKAPLRACCRPALLTLHASSMHDTAATYPQPETEKERSPIDYPQEWITPQPSKRPDIFPDFEELQTPLPKPMPGDPEQPEDEEWDEEQKKKPDTDPDKEPPEEDEEEEDKEGEDDEEEKKEGPQPEE